VDVVFNFAYSEDSKPSYYYLWKWIFALVLYVSSAAILVALFFIVAGKDHSEHAPKAIEYVDSKDEVKPD